MTPAFTSCPKCKIVIAFGKPCPKCATPPERIQVRYLRKKKAQHRKN